MNVPATFTREQIASAFEVLGLDDLDELIAAVEISGTEVAIELFVPEDDGGMTHMLGELATVVISIPIDEGDVA